MRDRTLHTFKCSYPKYLLEREERAEQASCPPVPALRGSSSHLEGTRYFHILNNWGVMYGAQHLFMQVLLLEA